MIRSRMLSAVWWREKTSNKWIIGNGSLSWHYHRLFCWFIMTTRRHQLNLALTFAGTSQKVSATDCSGHSQTFRSLLVYLLWPEFSQGLSGNSRSRFNPSSRLRPNLTEQEQPLPSVSLSTDLASPTRFWKAEISPRHHQTAQPSGRQSSDWHTLFRGLPEHTEECLNVSEILSDPSLKPTFHSNMLY